jgi:hypothetical protein
VGPTGVAVGTPITGSGQLYPGKRIPFTVYSPPLHQANLDGAYSLQNVVITHRTMPTVTVAFPLLYTTAALPSRPVRPVGLTPVTGIWRPGHRHRRKRACTTGCSSPRRWTSRCRRLRHGVRPGCAAGARHDVIWATRCWDWWYAQGQTRRWSSSRAGNRRAGVDGPLHAETCQRHLLPTGADSLSEERRFTSSWPNSRSLPLPTPLLAQPTDDNLDGAYSQLERRGRGKQLRTARKATAKSCLQHALQQNRGLHLLLHRARPARTAHQRLERRTCHHARTGDAHANRNPCLAPTPTLRPRLRDANPWRRRRRKHRRPRDRDANSYSHAYGTPTETPTATADETPPRRQPSPPRRTTHRCSISVRAAAAAWAGSALPAPTSSPTT